MALESKGAFIWHAYNALDEQQNGEVNKTRLKVLSHNICMSVGIPSVIKNIGHFLDSLDDHTHNNHLSFLEYYFFIKTELFDKIRNSGEINANADLTKCDEVCWLVCLRKYLQRDLKIIDNKDAFKLFQLFNFLAEVEPSGAVACPVVMDSEEVELIVQKFCKIVGVEFEGEEFHRIAKEISSFNYQQLLVLLETQYCKTADPNLISSAIAEIHDETLVEVIKKGHLTKKGHRVGSWKDRWFVLTPYRLCYYTGRDEKEKKGDVPVTSNSAVECLPDKAEKFPSKHPHKFIFHSESRNLEMGAPDVRTRSEWVTALKNAIQYCNKPQSLQQMALTKRRQLREQKRKREEEEEEAKRQKEAAVEKTKLEMEALQQAKEEAEKRIQEGDKLREENLAKSKEEKDQLERDMQTKLEQLGMAHAQAEEKRTEEELKRQEEERRKREEMERELMDSRKETVEVEAKLAKEEELREAYEKRIKELETLQAELERHLEEETQAKRDEEIVRNAQARVLNEEIEKREQLELLQQQLDNLLKEEVQKRVDLEGEKARQEESLKQTQDSLECEREKLREAHEKIEKVREEKASVTEKMNVKKEEKISFMARLNRLLKPEDKDPNPTTHRGVGSITATECKVKERKFSTERLLSVPREDGQSPHSDSWMSHDNTETPILDAMYDNLPRATDQNDNPIPEGDEAAEEDAFNSENNEDDVKVDQTDNKTDDKMDDQTADKMADKMDEGVTALSS